MAAERVNAIAVHGRRAARAGRIAYSIGDVVFLIPKGLSVLFIEANNSLFADQAPFAAALGKRFAVIQDQIRDKDPAVGKCRPGVSLADFLSPNVFRLFRKGIDDAGFARTPWLGPKILGPVV